MPLALRPGLTVTTGQRRRKHAGTEHSILCLPDVWQGGAVQAFKPPSAPRGCCPGARIMRRNRPCSIPRNAVKYRPLKETACKHSRPGFAPRVTEPYDRCLDATSVPLHLGTQLSVLNRLSRQAGSALQKSGSRSAGFLQRGLPPPTRRPPCRSQFQRPGLYQRSTEPATIVSIFQHWRRGLPLLPEGSRGRPRN